MASKEISKMRKLILLRPASYIGSTEAQTRKLWVYQNEEMLNRLLTYVPGFLKIFDEILINATENKQRDPLMDSVKVVIDDENKLIHVYYNGVGIPTERHRETGDYLPKLMFGDLTTSCIYDDNSTGGRNRYGAKLTNIFSDEFTIETSDGKNKYKQV